MSRTVLQVKNISVWYPLRGGVFSRVDHYVKAVRSLSFSLQEREILAIVGESGCGKSTLAQALVGLALWHEGAYTLFGEPVDVGSGAQWKKARQKIQMIFQDPVSSLNPRQTVSEILCYPLLARGVSRVKAMEKAVEMLQRVGLLPEILERFPHEFSGGQRQRLGIARALMLSPEILVCDEVTSALDVSVQAQVLKLLDELRHSLGLSLIFISHDMQVVRAFADRVLVMYLGESMEEGPVATVLHSPQHPYTRALIRSIPTLDRSAPPEILDGDIEAVPDDYCGCSFAARCPEIREDCKTHNIEMLTDGITGVRCLLCTEPKS
jgi:oligopeptide/dipeptide ABC transporter ATP-binding protein